MHSSKPEHGDKRSNPRFPFSSAVMLENYRTQICHDGRMIDYSRGVMGFETSASLEVGSEIFIGMDESPYSKAHDEFRARIVWLRELSLNQSAYPYSVGVMYC
jgi:hypothetical protein